MIHLIDYVNTTYSNVVSVKKEDSAIAGISLGGTTALYNGYLFKERFKFVAGISPNYQLLTSKERKIFNGWIAKPEDFVLGTDNGVLLLLVMVLLIQEQARIQDIIVMFSMKMVSIIFLRFFQMEVIIGRPLENFFIYLCLMIFSANEWIRKGNVVNKSVRWRNH